MDSNVSTSRKHSHEEEIVFCTHCNTWQSRRNERRHWRLEQGLVPQQRQRTSRHGRATSGPSIEQTAPALEDPGPSNTHQVGAEGLGPAVTDPSQDSLGEAPGESVIYIFYS